MKTTVVAPPHIGGTPVLLLVKTPLQPPDAEAVASQFANAVLTSICVWQAAVVRLEGQFKLTFGLGLTVNVLEQLVVAPQLLVAVNTTVFTSPQAAGAPVLLVVITALQLEEVVAVASHAA